MNDIVDPASFRDPSGFLFMRDGILYRQVNATYRDNYEHFVSSGLYEKLVQEKLLVPHEEVNIPFCQDNKTQAIDSENKGYKIIKPEKVPFISYPYEWSFSQLKDAALTMLKIQKLAFAVGMSLKDASAYNIQFLRGKPIHIDTLSFEIYQEGKPWVGYGQFCRHFLAPLALMSYTDTRLGQLLRIYLDGIPLDLAASLLPFSARWNMSLDMHIFLHGWSQKRYENKITLSRGSTGLPIQGRKVSRLGFQGIIESLEKAVKKLKWLPVATEWGDYYQSTNYSPAAFEHKKELISTYIDRVIPREVWDLGANNGLFSRIAAHKNIPTIAYDIDPAAVEMNYLACRKNEEKQMLPLLLDVTNPSPGIGWENCERVSFLERGPVDLIFCLALIHHLAIGHNISFEKIAHFLSRLCRFAIIEFVPKDDSQVQRLLAARQDIFTTYTRESFEDVFSHYFNILYTNPINDSQRVLYLIEKK